MHGRDRVCGLNEDGRAICVGRHRTITDQAAEFSSFSLGLEYACGLKTDGAIACWGGNALGESSSPEGSFSSLSAGKRHVCALDSDGAAACWGWDKDGRATPPDARFIAIAAGGTHSCGIAEFGNLICWGSNPDGRSDPMEGPFSALALGDAHTCAIRTDGETVCQGNDEYGQATPPPTVFSRIAAGQGWTCGIAPEGGLECWGSVSVSDHSETLAAVSPGHARVVCALTAEGEAKCWRETPPGEDPLNGVWLANPVEMFPWPAGGLAVADRRGYVEIHHPEGGEPTLALDLTERTHCCFGEYGMLSAALDPDFDRFPFIYIYWQTRGGAPDADSFEGRVSRFPVADSGAIDAGGELVILRLRQRGGKHFGGAIRFGADGMLHLGLGDLAEINDSPIHPSQDLSTLAGKIIRIDIRGAAEGEPYRVPPDNPFVDAPGARPEIWAQGLRNPWRMSFAPNSELIVADVGQMSREEVSIASRGANLGWPIFEGGLCVAEDRRLCDGGENYTFPIYEYPIAHGDCAIIGGAFDSGGRYIFGDHCSGRIWALERTAPDVWSAAGILGVSNPILAFGTDADGAVYALRALSPVSKASE